MLLRNSLIIYNKLIKDKNISKLFLVNLLGKCVARTQFIVDLKSIIFLHQKYCKNIIFL